MEMHLIREPSNDVCTIGSLYIDDRFECFCLEDPVREIEGQPVESWKIPGKTAIPRGRYQVEITYSNRFSKYLPELENVPGFSGIRMHCGNTDADTSGCILLGTKTDGNSLIESKNAFDLFMPILQHAINNSEIVWITIE